jgi:multiple sugar transport system substrate-binding protein
MSKVKCFCIAALAAVILPGMLFAGGGGQSGEVASSQKVEEVFFFNSVGAYRKLYEEMVQEWNDTEGAKKGVFIQMETYIDNYSPVLQSMLDAGNIPDLIDAYAHPDWIAAGITQNLYNIPEVQDLVTRFKPYLQQGVNLRGDNLVAFPLEILPLKAVYNKEIYKKAGLSAPPKTWAEMIEHAKKITEAGKGEFYGFGWTTMWVGGAFQRLAMQSTMNSTGVAYFDNSRGVYDFKPFKTVIEAIAKMYQDGSMFPTPMDQHIDPIRNRFAEGRVGIEMAPAYDVSVYNTQFPCNFDWGVFDVPTYEPGPPKFKGAALNRANVSITKNVTKERMPAVSEAFHFLHSEYLYKRVYANSGMIPHEERLIKEAVMEKAMKNWDVMSITTNYTTVPPTPDALLTIEGDNLHVTFEKIMLGNSTFDREVDALNQRYNDAYQKAKAQGRIDTAIYEFPFSMKRD